MSKKQNYTNAEKCRKPWPANCLWPEPLWDGNGDSWTADEIDLEWFARTCPQGKDLADVKCARLPHQQIVRICSISSASSMSRCAPGNR